MSIKFEFNHPIEKMWRFLSDIEFIHKAMGMPPVTYETKLNPAGGSHRFGSYRVFGMKLAWFEFPYEWIEHRFFSFETSYESGPVKYVKSVCKFEPSREGCKVHQTIQFQVNNILILPIVCFDLFVMTRKKIQSVYNRINRLPLIELDFEKTNAGKSLLKAFDFTPSRQVKKTLTELLFQTNIPKEFHVRFEELIFDSQESELTRIQPFRVARKWELPREKALEMFLKATRSGIFNLSWDLICPNCRGSKVRVPSLAQLKKEAHCPQCNVRFDSEFDKSLELSFVVHPSLRIVKTVEYCSGSPQNSKNFMAQLRIQPQETKTVKICLKEGFYELRSLQGKIKYQITAGELEGAGSKLHVILRDGVEDHKLLSSKADMVEWTFQNLLPHEVTLNLERSDWARDQCTAAYAANFQVFRDLFSFELLQPGIEFGISSVVILFSDLVESTSLYQSLGDPRAFALINSHLSSLVECVNEHHGAVVKTIGDSVMASFLKPQDAIKAAIAIHSLTQEVARKFQPDQELQVKVGIHCGPCYLVNRANNLDYFGTTVNVSARTLQECKGPQILITGRMMEDPGVRQTLRKEKILANQIVRNLKGLNKEFELYEIVPS